MPSSPRSFYRGKEPRPGPERREKETAKGRRNGERLRRNKTAMLHVDVKTKGRRGTRAADRGGRARGRE